MRLPSSEMRVDIVTSSVRCHACEAWIPSFTTVFMTGTGPAFFPICRGCFEHEMARRIAAERPQ